MEWLRSLRLDRVRREDSQAGTVPRKIAKRIELWKEREERFS